jgi:hypothetical protein
MARVMDKPAAGYDREGNAIAYTPSLTPLFIETSPHGDTESTDLRFVFGREDLGTLTVPLDRFAEFISAIRTGFVFSTVRGRSETE